jgi:toxin FitB
VLTNGGQAEHFLALIADERALVVPAFTIYEVYKWVLREHGEAQAVQAAAVMQGAQVVDLDSRLALAAAQLSHALQLPMADSIILATARDQQARLHTMDSNFRGIADVEWLGSEQPELARRRYGKLPDRRRGLPIHTRNLLDSQLRLVSSTDMQLQTQRGGVPATATNP